MGIVWECLWLWLFDLFDVLVVVDYGDCVFDFGQFEVVLGVIEWYVDVIFVCGCVMLMFGGDYFIMYLLFKVYVKVYGLLLFVYFDVYIDMWFDCDVKCIDYGMMFYYVVWEGWVVFE